MNDNKEMEGYYINGTKNGIWTWWYDTGIKKSEGNYIDNEQDGLWSYFANDGSIDEEISFSNGKKDGRSTLWLTPEEKQEEKFYRNGRLDGPSGVWTYWNAKGEKDFDFDFGTGLEHIDLEDAPERDGLFYKINEDVPFTGILTHKDIETGYEFLGRVKNGKKDGQWVKWFPSGKEVPEIIIVDVPVPEPKKPWSGGKQEQGG